MKCIAIKYFNYLYFNYCTILNFITSILSSWWCDNSCW